MKPCRGEIWLIDLNPVKGREQSGVRPALIVSVDMFNHGYAELLIVLPITSRFKGIPSHVEVNDAGLSMKSYIKTEDIRSISTERLVKKLGIIDIETMRLVEDRLKLLLGI